MSRTVAIDAMPYREKMKPAFVAKQEGKANSDDRRERWNKSHRANRGNSVCRERISTFLSED